MNMKKRVFNYILLIVVFLALSFTFVSADSGWYVNDAHSMVPQFFEGVFAIGSSGTAPLSSDRVYALTKNGLQLLGITNPASELKYENHRINIASNTVRAGLNYYYSASRDTSVGSAVLENLYGSGYSVGHIGTDGTFAESVSVSGTKLTVKYSGDTCISVYAEGESEPVYVADTSGRNDYLIVHPISDRPTTYARHSYYGDFCFAVIGSGQLTVVNMIDIDHYVMGVCACEMSEYWPIEALKAQAVAARTFVQKNISSSVYYYTCGFDVTADTYCQAYNGCGNVGSNIEAAVSGTNNLYLTYNDKLIDAMYSSSDGGSTESNANVFGSTAHPYLVGVTDPYEAAAGSSNPYSSWEVTMTRSQLGSKVGLGPVVSVTPTYSETGNVIKLDLVAADGQKATIIRDSCRTVPGLKSIHYEVTQNSSGNYVFSGGGFGHNVGMSQWGAYAMAKYYNKDYRSILGFYYTGVGLSYGELK